MSGKLCPEHDVRISKAYCDGRRIAAAGGADTDNPFPLGEQRGDNPYAVTGVSEDDNALTWTSVLNEAFTVNLVDPEGNDQVLGVVVDTRDITVNLATGPAGAITSTAADVLAAIEADDPGATDLVTMADTGDSDGTGVVIAESVSSSTVAPVITVPEATVWNDGFESWTDDPANSPSVVQGRDCCGAGLLYGGGYS